MNILPHKSWHVWRRDNIARVERDEAEHRKQIEEEKARTLARERSERFRRLRGEILPAPVSPPREGKEEVSSSEKSRTKSPSTLEGKGGRDQSRRRHFSLFPEADKQWHVQERKKKHIQAQLEHDPLPLGGTRPQDVRLGSGLEVGASELPEDPQTYKERRRKRRQEKKKRELDPMEEVSRALHRRVARDVDPRARRVDQEARRLSLREKRLQREEREKHKADQLLQQEGRANQAPRSSHSSRSRWD